jgi:hypothetical protein
MIQNREVEVSTLVLKDTIGSGAISENLSYRVAIPHIEGWQTS